MKSIKDILHGLSRLKPVLYITIVFLIGFLLRSGNETPQSYPIQIDATKEIAVHQWTCSMHPQIRKPGPGQCPICGMDLIPVITETAEAGSSPRELKLSPRAAKLAELQVAPVERKLVTKDIRMVGKVEYDESRMGVISAWLPGRIDRLFVDYTGIPVRKGDHLVEIYSPELFSAQEELIQALKSVRDLEKGKLSTTRDLSLKMVEAAREKLRLLGMTHEQIADFEHQGKPSDHVTIYSPTEGIVVHKNAVEGLYVTTGTKIYTIADLSQVWVKLDVYESDMKWIRYGQDIEFSTEAYPGEIFKGKIAFIDPVFNDITRTVKVRVNVPNPVGKLKPDMFVRATVHSQVASGGKVIDESLAGKYICPMHPEIVKNAQASCDICGMPLVKAESLGYISPRQAEPSLLIPATAPLITGTRAVVYVAVPDKDGTYEGREIVLGPRVGDYYQVSEGVHEGELVVVNGNFKIDSAIQILAGPSMMNPQGGAAPAHIHGQTPELRTAGQMKEQSAGVQPHDNTVHSSEHTGTATKDMDMSKKSEAFTAPDTFKKQFDGVIEAYYTVQSALSHDSPEGVVKGSANMLSALEKVDMMLLSGQAHIAWMEELNIIKKNGATITKANTIAAAREAFKPLSESIIRVTKKFGITGALGVYRFHCPMAFDGKGADWLQGTSGIANPWFGSSMPKCGSLEETISEVPGSIKPAEQKQK